MVDSNVDDISKVLPDTVQPEAVFVRPMVMRCRHGDCSGVLNLFRSENSDRIWCSYQLHQFDATLIRQQKQ